MANKAETSSIYYQNNRLAGDGKIIAGLNAANLTLGTVVGYTTYLEGYLGIDSLTGRELTYIERRNRVLLGSIQIGLSAAAGAEGLHGLRGVSSKHTGFEKQLGRQLEKDDSKSIYKSLRSLKKSLLKHQQKVDNLLIFPRKSGHNEERMVG